MDFYGFEKLSLVDYDGYIAATLFTGGCNMRCPFCHNGSLVLGLENVNKIPFSEIYSYLEKRAGMLEAVCITGGEPTIMPDLEVSIKKIKSLGYKVKLDTNGSNPTVLKNLISNNLLDYIAMDIKNSEKEYFKTIGTNLISIDNIKDSISIIKNSGIDYEFRTTLVREFHYEACVEGILELIGVDAKKIILQHFKESPDIIKKGLNEVPKNEALEYKKILKRSIPFVELRGYK